MTATLNGRPPRKQLSDQLDRLDGIVDLLADALPQAVADACREGAKAAMTAAVLELLAHPEVRALLAGRSAAAGTAPPPQVTEAKPTWWQRLKTKMKHLKEAVVERATAAVQAVTLTAKMLTAVLPLRRIALVTIGVGLAVAVVGLVLARLCPPAVTAAVGGLGAAVTAAASQVAGGLRRAGWLAAR